MLERPRVAVIFTGGTIAMLPDPLTGAAVPTLDGAGILARTPGLGAIAELEAIDWGLVPASHLRFSQILEIGALIAETSARSDIGGIVVVQGTDVLEETAWAWDLLHTAATPVAVVGAMRNAADADYDGPANLADAVRVATETRLRGQGVVVVMAGLILPADDVTKTDSQALDTFQALDTGPLGRVHDGVVVLERDRGPRRTLAEPPAAAAEPVTLLTAVVSTDGHLLRAAVEQGARGIVVEATGSGNTDPDLLAAAVEAMAADVPVVLTTRCASGAVGPLYGFPGGGRSWQESGAILAGTLSGPKARVALALGLGAGLERAGLGRLLGEGSDVANDG
jgi:L-asparaginase